MPPSISIIFNRSSSGGRASRVALGVGAEVTVVERSITRLGQLDEQLFAALARGAALRVSEFNAQEIANTAWAFATLGQRDEKLPAAMAVTLTKPRGREIRQLEPRSRRGGATARRSAGSVQQARLL